MTTEENLDIILESEESLKNYTALRNATEKILDNLLSSDPILSDIPYDITYEEVLGQIAVVKGQAITIFVERENLSTLKVIVPELNTTVSDLKKAIRRAFDLEQNRLRRRLKNQHNKSDNSNKNSDSEEDDNHLHHHRRHKSTKSSSSSLTSVTAATTSSDFKKSGSSRTNFSIEPIVVNKTKISWKYIWRTYLLENSFNNQPLIENNQLLSSYGVVNKTILKFVKRCKYQQRSQRKKLIKK